MKFLKKILLILVIFLPSGNIFSEESLFNVNNIELLKKANISNNKLANKAIKLGFEELTKKILLQNDYKKLSQLNFQEIKQLVSYYQIIDKKIENKNIKENIVNFNIFFDRDKLHDLFYKKNIFYSDISNKELYLLPILYKEDRIFIYTNNYFYQQWTEIDEKNLIEFILPLENIEIIQNLNKNKNNILNLDLKDLFKEYSNKNLALVILEEVNQTIKKIYLRTRIQDKYIDKSILISEEKSNNKEDHYKNIIKKVNEEITNLVKSQNLIDVRTPSFLNAKFSLDKDNSLVELDKRLEKINLVEDIFVQEFNNKYVLLKIKFIGKLDRILKQLENQKIILKFINDQWSIKII